MSFYEKKVCLADIDKTKGCFHTIKKQFQVDRKKLLSVNFDCQKTKRVRFSGPTPPPP